MVIKVKTDDMKITIPFPTGLVLNGFTARLVKTFTEIPMTTKQMNLFIRELRRAKKLLGNTPLIEVHSGDNEDIVIKL